MRICWFIGSGQIIFGRVISMDLKNYKQFSFCSLSQVIHGDFKLKFWIWLCPENVQVKFVFGCGRISLERVEPLGL